MSRTLTLTIDYDPDAECPMSWDSGWTLASFSRKSVHYRDPAQYLKVRGKSVAPADVGLRRKMNVGLAFWLDYYEHGLASYHLRGEGPQCPWDTSRYAGCLVWEHPPAHLGAKTFPERIKDARRFLETYNAWMNGWVYWYSLEDAGGNHIDSCGGFFEPDYMSEEIAAGLSPGDRLLVAGPCAGVFDKAKLPAGVLEGEAVPC